MTSTEFLKLWIFKVLYRKKKVSFFFSLLFIAITAFGQDSSKVVKPHSPRKATIMSAVLPGAGQAYNRKYWKIPIIYAGLGTLGYLMSNNIHSYKQYKTLYIESQYTNSVARTYMNSYRKNIELCIIGLTAFYALNIIDANVDAHLFQFDMSDDLSLKVMPASLNLAISIPGKETQTPLIQKSLF